MGMSNDNHCEPASQMSRNYSQKGDPVLSNCKTSITSDVQDAKENISHFYKKSTVARNAFKNLTV